MSRALPPLTRRVVAPLVASAAAVAYLPGVAAAATPQHTYQHGAYAQAHFSSQGSCTTARDSAVRGLKQAKRTSIAFGPCHQIDVQAGTAHWTGWVYDGTYVGSRAYWSSDADLGTKPAATAGRHSYRVKGSATTSAAATTQMSADIASIRKLSGSRVTWQTGVKKNAVNGRFEYEINYDARMAFSSRSVKISERQGVTSPSLGITQPIPTKPVVTPPATTVTPPAGPIKTTNQTTSGGTKTTTTTTAQPGGTVTSTTTKTPTTGGASTTTNQTIGIQGIDISGHTTVNDWPGWRNAGVKFMWIKATEGNYYLNEKFTPQYTGAYSNGFIRGAYHFANPASSTGADQADYFLAHGGGWSGDGKTLPGALDMEWNPYGDACYGLSQVQMNTWIRAFIAEYKAKTGVNPIIYTATSWWNKCVGTASYTDVPLWLARYNTTVGPLPTSWTGGRHTVWQNSDGNGKGYDTNIFNGTLSELTAYATTGRR